MANTKEFNVSTNAMTVLNQTADAAENTAKGFTSAKAELRALQNQMLQMDQTSAEFKKASARASELKDKIEELGENVRANVGNSFEQASNSVSLFTSRLLGGDLKGAGDALTNLGGAVGKISFKELQTEVGGLAKGILNLGKAVLSNPFFLAAAALTAMIVYYKEIGDAINGTAEKVKKLEESNVVLEKQNLILDNRINKEKTLYGESFKTLNLEKEKAQNNIKVAENELIIAQRTGDINVIREKENKLIEMRNLLSGITAKGEADRVKLVEEAKNITIKGYKEEQDRQAAIAKFEDARQEQLSVIAKKQREIYAQIEIDRINSGQWLELKEKKDILDLKNQEKRLIVSNEEYQLQQELAKLKEEEQILRNAKVAIATGTTVNELKKEEVKTQKDLNKELKVEKEIVDNSAEEFRQAYNAISDAAKQQTKENELRLLNEKDRELQINKEKYDALIAEADLRGVNTKVFIDAQLAEEDAIKKKWRDKENEDNAIQAAKQLDLLQQAEGAKAQLRIDAMKTSLSIIGDLAQAFAGESERQQRKAFNIQKGVSIATATIDTYLAAQGAYRSQMAISTPDAPVRAAVAAGIAIAQGLARVAVISKQQFNGGGGTSGGNGGGNLPSSSGGTNAPTPANFSFLGNQPNQQQPPLQAYVVSGQVSSNIEAQQLINNQSRLGG